MVKAIATAAAARAIKMISKSSRMGSWKQTAASLTAIASISARVGLQLSGRDHDVLLNASHDGTGRFRYRDFCALLAEARDKMQAATTSMVFTAFVREDTKDQGNLDSEGMMRVLTELNPEMAENSKSPLLPKARALMRELDRGGDNQFSFQEAEQIVWRVREFRESMRRSQEETIRDNCQLRPDLFKEFRSQLIELHSAFQTLVHGLTTSSLGYRILWHIHTSACLTWSSETSSFLIASGRPPHMLRNSSPSLQSPPSIISSTPEPCCGRSCHEGPVMGPSTASSGSSVL